MAAEVVDWIEVADLTEVVTDALLVGLEDMALETDLDSEGNLVMEGSSCIEVH